MEDVSYIYLLTDEVNNRVKIGKADDVYNRYLQLKNTWPNIDLEKSFRIKVRNKDVYDIEKTLHLSLKKYNVKDLSGDGYSEWFDGSCLDLIKKTFSLLESTYNQKFKYQNAVNKSDIILKLYEDGLTQQEISYKCGLSQSAISKIINKLKRNSDNPVTKINKQILKMENDIKNINKRFVILQEELVLLNNENLKG